MYTTNYTVIQTELMRFVIAFEYLIDGPKDDFGTEEIQEALSDLEGLSDDDLVELWRSETDTQEENIFVCDDIGDAKVSNIIDGHRCVACGAFFKDLNGLAEDHAKEQHKPFLELFSIHRLECFAPVFLANSKYKSRLHGKVSVEGSVSPEEFFNDHEDLFSPVINKIGAANTELKSKGTGTIMCPVPINRNTKD